MSLTALSTVAFLSTSHLVAASKFTTNCTIPTEPSTIVTSPNIRGTFQILWSGLFTIFICIWTVQHLNIPEPRGSWKGFKPKLKWMFINLVLPEALLGLAIAEYQRARLDVKRLQETKEWEPIEGRHIEVSQEEQVQWSMVHAYYANMGGFATVQRDGPYPGIKYLNCERLYELREEGILSRLPAMRKDQILDKSKGDFFAKTTAIVQVTWMAIQVIERAYQGLPISQLEVTACAFAATTIITYLLWWKKPQGVGLPTEILLDHALPQEKQDRFPSTAPLNEFFQFTRTNGASLAFVFSSILLGGIQCAAWNFYFPSKSEQVLWRILSVIIPIFRRHNPLMNRIPDGPDVPKRSALIRSGSTTSGSYSNDGSSSSSFQKSLRRSSSSERESPNAAKKVRRCRSLDEESRVPPLNTAFRDALFGNLNARRSETSSETGELGTPSDPTDPNTPPIPLPPPPQVVKPTDDSDKKAPKPRHRPLVDSSSSSKLLQEVLHDRFRRKVTGFLDMLSASASGLEEGPTSTAEETEDDIHVEHVEDVEHSQYPEHSGPVEQSEHLKNPQHLDNSEHVVHSGHLKNSEQVNQEEARAEKKPDFQGDGANDEEGGDIGNNLLQETDERPDATIPYIDIFDFEDIDDIPADLTYESTLGIKLFGPPNDQIPVITQPELWCRWKESVLSGIEPKEWEEARNLHEAMASEKEELARVIEYLPQDGPAIPEKHPQYDSASQLPPEILTKMVRILLKSKPPRVLNKEDASGVELSSMKEDSRPVKQVRFDMSYEQAAEDLSGEEALGELSWWSKIGIISLVAVIVLVVPGL
ncbi:hypothetical protein G7Y89_g6053 [Cudoniella acicularis]|uniref:Uncharacterized protein n=1 Tax=Cudoniella acicularis TaxID=354080 RepID=A0A8H4RNH6_9HELO|nr:hypothetical protein G7Y89_g6053 [Cudoniella acicularis]